MLFLIFILGLLVGSFLNVVIFRLHSHEAFLFGRSHCNTCKRELGVWDLIPLFSYLFLRGKCRYCQAHISWQYPMVELLTAFVFVLLGAKFGVVNLEFLIGVIFACVMIVIAVYDFKHYLILDVVIFPALALSVFINLISGSFVDGILGSILVSGFFLIQYLISKGSWIGFGDVKLGLLLGSLFGWKMSIILLLVSYMTGALVGTFLLILNKKKMSSKLPFGTFLGLSAIIILIYGDQILSWYRNLIGL